MNKTTLGFLLLLLVLWILLALYFCRPCLRLWVTTETPDTKELTYLNTVPKQNTSVIALPWIIRDGTNQFEADHHFRFLESDFKQLESNQELITTISSYLAGHKDRSLQIVGYYDDREDNGSIYPNLGVARAYTIKQLFVGAGIASQQLSIKGVELSQDWLQADTLQKGIDLNFEVFTNNETLLTNIFSDLKANPLRLYFDIDQQTIDLSEEQRKQISDIVYYLDKVEEAKIRVSGHTDDEGEYVYNKRLSRKKAEFIVNYFNKNGGITKERMVAIGFGPDKPIASNTYSKGRAQNRRVDISLLK